ncbi:MAG: DUF2092 domain-containing protein, partial [Gemmataceae bacterium]
MRSYLECSSSSRRVMTRRAAALAVCVASVMWTTLVAGAQQNSPSATAEVAADAAQAKATLMRMADFLAVAKRFSVADESGYDVMQESGAKIEFGQTRHVLVDRPN